MAWRFPIWYLFSVVFSPKSFGFFCIRLLVCFRVFFHLLVEFSLVFFFFFFFWNVLFFVCIVLPFLDIFLIFRLSPVLSGSFPKVVLLFFLYYLLSLHVPVSFLSFIILACFCRFFICVSSRISHPGFDLFFVLFVGTLIFSQTNFVSV